MADWDKEGAGIQELEESVEFQSAYLQGWEACRNDLEVGSRAKWRNFLGLQEKIDKAAYDELVSDQFWYALAIENPQLERALTTAVVRLLIE